MATRSWAEFDAAARRVLADIETAEPGRESFQEIGALIGVAADDEHEHHDEARKIIAGLLDVAMAHRGRVPSRDALTARWGSEAVDLMIDAWPAIQSLGASYERFVRGERCEDTQEATWAEGASVAVATHPGDGGKALVAGVASASLEVVARKFKIDLDELVNAVVSSIYRRRHPSHGFRPIGDIANARAYIGRALQLRANDVVRELAGRDPARNLRPSSPREDPSVGGRAIGRGARDPEERAARQGTDRDGVEAGDAASVERVQIPPGTRRRWRSVWRALGRRRRVHDEEDLYQLLDGLFSPRASAELGPDDESLILSKLQDAFARHRTRTGGQESVRDDQKVMTLRELAAALDRPKHQIKYAYRVALRHGAIARKSENGTVVVGADTITRIRRVLAGSVRSRT